MNKEQIIKQLEEMGYFVEEQPKYKITIDKDEEFLIQTDDLKEFFISVVGIKNNSLYNTK